MHFKTGTDQFGMFLARLISRQRVTRGNVIGADH